jgi:PAS domain S-box-containing protein
MTGERSSGPPPVTGVCLPDGGSPDAGHATREELLTRLHEATRRLVRANDAAGVGDVAVEAARNLLGYEVVVFGVRESDPDRIRPLSTSEAADRVFDGPPVVEPGSRSWDAFEAGEPAALGDVDLGPRATVEDGRILPIGDYGLLVVGRVGETAATDGDLLGHLAASAETALELVARESSLREERDRIATLFENTSDAIAEIEFVDGDPIVAGTNPAFERTFGLEETAVRGRSLDDVIAPPDRRDEAESYSERARAGERLETEVRRETATGVRDFLLRAVPFDREGTRSRSYAIYTDITDRKRYERTLGALHETARELMRADAAEEIAAIAVDAAGRILGYPVNGVRLYDPETDALALAAASDSTEAVMGERPPYPRGDGVVWEAFDSGTVRVVDDVRELEDDYDRHGIRSALYLPLGDHGTISLGATAPAGFDEADVHLARVLAANVEVALDRAARTSLLRRRERELARQNDRLEQFTSVVSHDLRNPLSVATGHLDLAREAEDEAAAADHFDRVERAHERMDRLISDLLTLARQGRAVGEPEVVGLRETAEEAWRSAETGGASLTVVGDRTLEADRERLCTLFENLFRNSVEHGTGADRTAGAGGATGPSDGGPADGCGGGQRGADATTDRAPHWSGDGPVSVVVGPTDGGFYVADDGPGVPSAERERVFERGYTTADAGTGFGLNIVRDVADAHGWAVELTGSAAGGARFDVTGVDGDRETDVDEGR